MDVFALFANTEYQFLKVSQKAQGNAIEEEFNGIGIARLKENMSQVDNMEDRLSQSTLHIRTDEPFISEVDGKLVGHGIRIANKSGELIDYRITNASQAPDYEEADFPFYRLILKQEDFSPWQSELPLS